MFMFDVETLHTQSNAVVLSMACVHFKVEDKPTPDDLRKNSIFIKFDVTEQIKKYHRATSKSTMEWWNKQCDIVRQKSFLPSSNDVTMKDGHDQFAKWAKERDDGKCWIWARGNMDQVVLSSMEEMLDKESVFSYNRWRDVRTAVDFLYGTTNGYCTIDYSDFDPAVHIYKHDPVDDCIFDAMMLMYGEKVE